MLRLGRKRKQPAAARSSEAAAVDVPTAHTCYRVDGRKLPLPAGWTEVADGQFRLVKAPERGTTTLDPRYLQEPWRMSMDAAGRPMFTYCEGKTPTYTDPRGAPGEEGEWKMMIDEGSGRPYWANSKHLFTTFVDPRGLPDGFELRSIDNCPHYINHVRKINTRHDPRSHSQPSLRQAWLERDLKGYIERQRALCEEATHHQQDAGLLAVVSRLLDSRSSSKRTASAAALGAGSRTASVAALHWGQSNRWVRSNRSRHPEQQPPAAGRSAAPHATAATAAAGTPRDDSAAAASHGSEPPIQDAPRRAPRLMVISLRQGGTLKRLLQRGGRLDASRRASPQPVTSPQSVTVALGTITMHDVDGDGDGAMPAASASAVLPTDAADATGDATNQTVATTAANVDVEVATAELPPTELYCPISYSLLTEAVMTSSGHIYNESAIRRWLHVHPGEDPISRSAITNVLVPAFAVRTMANRWAEKGFT